MITESAADPGSEPTAPTPRALVDYWERALRTHVGLVRAGNEDYGIVTDEVALVADGLGGHNAGEIASRMTIDFVAGYLDLIPREDRTKLDIYVAVRTAHDQVLSRAAADPEMAGMATTLTGLVRLAGGQVAVVNVGDSRTYRVDDDGALVQVTRDDSLVTRLVEEGRISPDFAPFHPQRHLIDAAVGLPCQNLPVSVQAVPPAGRYVMCSDGLSDVFDANSLHDRAAQAVDRRRSPDQAAQDLVALALEGGGPDNVTVVVVDLT